MRISSLKTRKKFWSEHYMASCMGLSDPAPFKALDDWQDLFDGKSVLEVGPGAGRQTALAMPLANEYGVADIVPEVLALSLYADAWQHLLKSYTIPGNVEYDVAMCFYVLHHVTKREGAAFVQMLADAVRPGGVVLLNAPDDNMPVVDKPKSKREEGTRTTGWTNAEVVVRSCRSERGADEGPRCQQRGVRGNEGLRRTNRSQQ